MAQNRTLNRTPHDVECEHWHSAVESEVLLDTEVDGVRCLLQTVSHHHLLSPRELEIARMIAEGKPNKVVAAVLEISVWTVSTHLRRIFTKLHVSSRAAMVARIMPELGSKQRSEAAGMEKPSL